MPYMKVPEDGKWGVYKQGADGKPEGKCLGTHDDEKKADAQIAAIEENEKALGAKFWDGDDDDFAPVMRAAPALWQDDKRVAYTALGGLTGGQACANCEWFRARCAGCTLVDGPIVATGTCKLWLARPTPEPMQPVPVVIVNQPAPEMEPETEGAASFGKRLLDSVKGLLGVFKGKDGEAPVTGGFKALPDMRWVAFWTNNAEDRQKETFSAAAIDAYLDRVDSGAVPVPDLWFWHIPYAYGKAEWLGREDHITIAVGRFHDTPEGRAMHAHYSKKEVADGTSHGFTYYRSALVDGVYQQFNTFEISPLPPDQAANPYTTFEEVKAMAISEKKRQALEGILGKELAEGVLAQAGQRSKELDALGLQFKEGQALPAADDEARDALKALAESQKALADAMKTATEQQATALKGVTDALGTVQASLQALQAQDAARAKEIADLKGYVSDQFKLQPRAIDASSTIVPPSAPFAQKMDAQMGGKDTSKPASVFDFMWKSAGIDTQAPKGEGEV